mmetsp:Transcript_16645/g.63304  ORF Transcript_16645/g.63304 Transcript_16645/m.63304 type:complete len:215 (-) Transcript_16645:324-968(-)
MSCLRVRFAGTPSSPAYTAFYHARTSSEKDLALTSARSLIEVVGEVEVSAGVDAGRAVHHELSPDRGERLSAAVLALCQVPLELDIAAPAAWVAGNGIRDGHHALRARGVIHGEEELVEVRPALVEDDRHFFLDLGRGHIASREANGELLEGAHVLAEELKRLLKLIGLREGRRQDAHRVDEGALQLARLTLTTASARFSEEVLKLGPFGRLVD